MSSIRWHLALTAWCDTAEFAVAGNALYSPSAGRWFDSLDTSKMGLVWWEEVLDDMIERMGSCCAGGPLSPVDTHIEIFNVPHCKVTCDLLASSEAFLTLEGRNQRIRL